MILIITMSAPSATIPEPPSDPKLPSVFQCGLCKQRYKRPDHLARHVRSHSQYKPHRCDICGKAFSRPDLLNRHVASHANGKTKSTANGDIRAVQTRVSRACRTCATNHLRCTEYKPCKRCVERGLECSWEPDGQVVMDVDQDNGEHDPPLPDPDATAVSRMGDNQQNDHSSHTVVVGTQQKHGQQQLQGEARAPDHALSHDSSFAGYQQQQQQQPMPTPQSQGQPPSQIPVQTNHEAPQVHGGGDTTEQMDHAPQGYGISPGPGLGADAHHYPAETATPRFPDWNFLPGWQTPTEGAAGASDLGGLAFPDFELDDMDMRFLDVYNHAVPFEFGSGSHSELTFGVQDQDSGRTTAGVSPGARRPASGPEAFRRHHWRFQPNAKDRAGAEEHNLSLPTNATEHASPESRVSVSARVTAAQLSVATRDKILTSVIRNCRSENLSRAVEFFPSVELLDKLLQYYLTSPMARADTFIHASTFDPNTKRQELLLAMAAAGAVLTSDATLSKLGYAMQEIVRPAVATLWESDNTLTRNLELLQAFLIQLEIGIWSGHSRKIEITESFLQAPLTMLRRAGRFKSSGYHDTASSPLAAMGHDPNLSGPELQSRWQSWVHDESYKRTALRLLTHDTNSSICLMVNPLLSYAEISLPLSCEPGLWTAASQDQWKAVLLLTQTHLQAGRVRPPPQSIADFADDPGSYTVTNTQVGQSPPSFDVALANQAFLSYAWGLCWEYIQLASLCRNSTSISTSHHPSSTAKKPPRRWNALILSSRQDEILKLLHQFRVVADPPNHHHHQSHHHQSQRPDASASASTTGPAAPSPSHTHDAQAARMKLEHILLHMHAPLEEIQTFAGMEGPEQAAGSQGVIVEWSASQAARTAVWHASQVVRVARRIAKGAVQGPLAFSLYHASLVLWTYAVVWSGEHEEASQQQQQQQQQQQHHQHQHRRRTSNAGETAVFLDEDGESMALQRFTQLGAGRPCFRSTPYNNNSSAAAAASTQGEGGGGGFVGGGGGRWDPGAGSSGNVEEVFLEEPDKVMGALVDVLCSNHRGLPRPHLADRLIQLMEALQRSPRVRGNN